MVDTAERPDFFGRDQICLQACGKTAVELMDAVIDGQKITLSASTEALYEGFVCFSAYERWLNPGDQFPSNSRYWEPVFRRIEAAHAAKDDDEIKAGLKLLISRVLEQ